VAIGVGFRVFFGCVLIGAMLDMAKVWERGFMDEDGGAPVGS